MSLDYTKDYSNHLLLDNKAKYSKIYKITESEASELSKGDIILLKTPCGKFGLFIVTADTGNDGTIHVSKYTDQEFISYDSYLESNTASSSVTYTTVGNCGCN
jgi:hypothetical protein